VIRLTGLTLPYEPPEAPALVLDTSRRTLAAAVKKIIAYLKAKAVL
jgi:adenylylsulfate kinase-like enzyme